MKKQTGKMLIQDMGLKVGERFNVGKYVFVYAGNAGRLDKFDTILPSRVWKKTKREAGRD